MSESLPPESIDPTRGNAEHWYVNGKYGGRGFPKGPLGTADIQGYYVALGFCPMCGENARNTTGVRGVYDCPTCTFVWHDDRVGEQQKSFGDYFSHS